MSFPKFLGITVLSLFLSYAAFFGLYTALNPPNLPVIEASEDARWIATSQSLTDRTACKWIGICGGNHWRSSTRWFRKGKPPEQKTIQTSHSHRTDWRDAVVKPTNWTRSERLLREIPDYVFEYAPLVHLFSGEEFWPADIAKHLQHVTPCLNYTLLQSQRSNLTNPLYNLNIWEEGHNVFLTSNENPGQAPDWLKASTNVPEPSEAKPEAGIDSQSTIAWNGRMEGEYIDESAKREGWYEAGQGGSHAAIKRSTRSISRFDPAVLDVSKVAGNTRATDARDQKLSSPKSGKGGRSNAPALLITVDKGEGIIDAFWFYFYSFNQGNRVLNIRFGNHVGDWEHSMVRFQHGKPKALFLSQHTFGGAYSYEAVEKIGKRPVLYSATGSHAMYATPGIHPYVLPLGLLHDETDRGPLWDPALNTHAYTYDYKADALRSSTKTPHAPTQWFYFSGHWGDKFYELNDTRQYRFAGQYHYVNGPFGPRFKNLGRKKLCQGRDGDPCEIKNWLESSRKTRRWESLGEGEELV